MISKSKDFYEGLRNKVHIVAADGLAPGHQQPQFWPDLSLTYTSLHLQELPVVYGLTNCGLVMPYGSRDLGQHWFK